MMLPPNRYTPARGLGSRVHACGPALAVLALLFACRAAYGQCEEDAPSTVVPPAATPPEITRSTVIIPPAGSPAAASSSRNRQGRAPKVSTQRYASTPVKTKAPSISREGGLSIDSPNAPIMLTDSTRRFPVSVRLPRSRNVQPNDWEVENKGLITDNAGTAVLQEGRRNEMRTVFRFGGDAETVDSSAAVVANEDTSGSGTRKLDRSRIAVSVPGGYVFTAAYDACTVRYEINGLQRNGICMPWHNWRSEFPEHSVDARTLRSGVVSEPFTLAAGEAITFQRSFTWTGAPRHREALRIVAPTDERGFDFSADEDLEYVVELVREGSETRLALLDSFGVAEQTLPAAPLIHTAGTFATAIRYFVPPSAGGARVMVRMVMLPRAGTARYSRGGRMRAPSISEYFRPLWRVHLVPEYDFPALAQDTLDPLMTVATDDEAGILVQLDGSFTERPASVVIYDSAGAYLYTPLTTTWATGLEHARYRPAGPGSYVVGLYSQSGLVAVRRVEIGERSAER